MEPTVKPHVVKPHVKPFIDSTRAAARHGLLLIGALALPLAPAAAAVVSVSFPQAERYTDAERGAEAERVRQALAQALTALGGSLLPAAQSLEVQVLDIDLAGERRPLRRAGADARVMRGTVDWPRIRLHFTWREGDRVLADEVADIADMDYLRQPQAGMSTSALPYERRMLDDWFHRRFAAPPAAH